MTKAAVARLTRGTARDLGPRGITVNVVQPGPTETDINDDAAMRDAIRPLMAIGRMGGRGGGRSGGLSGTQGLGYHQWIGANHRGYFA